MPFAAIYKKEKVFKNYEIFSNQIKIAKKNNKFQLLEVDRIDNNFLVKKNEIKTNPFDENYFLYFETIDKKLEIIISKNGKVIRANE